MRVASRGAACLELEVAADEPVQVSTKQPVDLAFHITGNAEYDLDSFEFGNETITLSVAGHYRIHIRPADSSQVSPWTLSMSRHPIPLQGALAWQQAEMAATKSKRSRKTEDILESLRLWTQLDDLSSIARTELKQADTAMQTSDYGGARDGYEQALTICSTLTDLRCAGEAANNSGNVSLFLGEFATSSQRLQEAAEIWRRLSLLEPEGQTLSNLGLLFLQSGDFEQAIRALTDSERLLSGRNPVGHARVLNNLGLYYQALSENEKAIAYFQSALSVFLAKHIHPVRVRLNLGRSYMLLGRLDESRESLESAYQEAKQTNDASGQANALNNLGQVLLKLHRGEEARARLTDALKMQRLLRSKWGEAVALHYLGVESRSRNDLEPARQFFGEAARIRRECGLRDDASESDFELAELEFQAGNLTGAKLLANRAIQSIESLRGKVPNAGLRASYYARKHRFFDLAEEIAMTPTGGDGEEGFLTSEQSRARSLLDLLSAGRDGARMPHELLERRASIRSEIAILSLRLNDAAPLQSSDPVKREWELRREQLRRRIEILLGEADEVEAEIQKSVDSSPAGRPIGSVSELRSTLPRGAALLEFYLGEKNSYLWVVQADGFQFFRLPPKTEIETLALRTSKEFGAILDRRRFPQREAAFQADLRRLSAMLLAPLSGVRLPSHLILVLDGALHQAPMEALRPSWARQPLGLTHDVMRMPSASYLLNAQASTPPARPLSVLAIADPVFGPDDPRVDSSAPQTHIPSLARIPFTGELATLKTLLPAGRLKILKGFDASAVVLRHMDLSRYGYLHFSTHAVVDDRIPELSHIALSLVDHAGRTVDGYLRPYQFGDFRLAGAVVVLSSCDTALGKDVPGEGLSGFATDLFAAGASQLVLSLSKADAESSSEFFSQTYRSIFGSPHTSMERAITLTRRAMAGSVRWSDPYYWASFVLIGGFNRPTGPGTAAK